VLGRERYYFAKKNHSNFTKRFSETGIINMLELLNDNIIAMFVGGAFQQTVGIPMGTICVPLLAYLFLCSYEANFMFFFLQNNIFPLLAQGICIYVGHSLL
jgi:hypothetical protein